MHDLMDDLDLTDMPYESEYNYSMRDAVYRFSETRLSGSPDTMPPKTSAPACDGLGPSVQTRDAR